MTTLEPASPDLNTAAAAYPDAGETMRLRAGRLRFFRTIAESVGVQGPTAGVVIAPAVLAAIVFTVRRRMAPVKTVILLIGLGVLGYVAKNTFAPLPPAPSTGTCSPPGSPWPPGSSCRSCTRRCGVGSPVPPPQSRCQRAARL